MRSGWVKFSFVALVAAMTVSALSEPASAAITTPTHGSTVRGVVQIHENRGGEYRDSIACSRGLANTAIEVRLPNGTTVLQRWEKGQEGSFTVNWDSIGRDNLNNYRILSFGRDRFWSCCSCKNSDWYVISDIRVHLDNRSAISYTGPTGGFWDESVEARARLVETTTGRAISGRSVKFTLDGQSGEVSGTTAGDGNATASMLLTADPDGTLIRPRFDGDSAFRSSATQAAFTVSKRPTTTSYLGETSAFALESASVSARLADTRNGAALEGRPVDFELLSDGAPLVSVSATTDEAGDASATLPTDVPKGSYTIRASVGEDSHYTGSSAATSFTVLPRPVAVDYTGDESGYWDEVAHLSAAVTDVLADEPLSSASVGFTLGNHGWSAETGPDGVASTEPLLDQVPDIYTASAAFPGDPFRDPASAEAAVEILKRPSLLVYDGPTSGYRGHGAALSAILTDERAGYALEGRTVEFTLGSFSGIGDSDGDGRAEVSVLLDQDPGMYNVGVGYEGDEYRSGAEDVLDFVIGWEHGFADDLGAARIHLNLTTQEFQFEAPDDVSSLKHDPDMLIVSTPTGVGEPQHPCPDDPLDCLPETPDDPSCIDEPSSGDPLCPGDYLPEQSSSGLGCESIPTAEGCRPHFVTIAFSDEEITIAGWFDVTIGAFSAIVETASGTYVLGASGSECTADPQGCMPQSPDPPECVDDPLGGDPICGKG